MSLTTANPGRGFIVLGGQDLSMATGIIDARYATDHRFAAHRNGGKLSCYLNVQFEGALHVVRNAASVSFTHYSC